MNILKEMDTTNEFTVIATGFWPSIGYLMTAATYDISQYEQILALITVIQAIYVDDDNDYVEDKELDYRENFIYAMQKLFKELANIELYHADVDEITTEKDDFITIWSDSFIEHQYPYKLEKIYILKDGKKYLVSKPTREQTIDAINVLMKELD
jgi:hypothetical protein